MRKLLIIPILFFFLISCGERKENKKNELTFEEVENVEVQQELKSADSIIEAIDSTLMNIQESHKALEDALKEIE